MGRRLFLAVHVSPDDEFLQALETIRKHLEQERINWVKPQNLHMTFKFFGDTPEDRIPDIITILSPAVATFPATWTTVGKLGIFGARFDPRVLWLGFDKGAEQLTELGTLLLDTLDTSGWPRDRQNFVPHVTLARIKYLNYKKRFREILDTYRESFHLGFEVNSVSLIESILHPSGPEYIPIHTFPLKPAGDAS